MKNAGIFDIGGFTEFLRIHQTEHVDLRKMISASNMDWKELMTKISQIPTIRGVCISKTRAPQPLTQWFQTNETNIELQLL